MFPTQQRLPLRQMPDFFRRASRKHTPTFSLFWISLDSSLPSQAAVITSKSATFKAVQRNTAKRKLRVLLSPLLKLRDGVGIAVQVKKPLTESDFASIQTEVQKILEK